MSRNGYSLNEITTLEKSKIHLGKVTKTVTISEAIEILENCKYENATKPYESTFKELLDFLKLNKS